MALVSRGINPVEVLTLLRGDWHCGYDPYLHRTAPQCTPLATNTLHAVGLAHAAQLAGEDTVAVVLLGDGATSEGDTHEALNIAAVWQAPVVFLVQNNGYAISVPLAKQTRAPTLAHKGIGYGMPGVLIDGNDAAMVHVAVTEAIERARRGERPDPDRGADLPDRGAHQRRRRHPLPAGRPRSASWLARDPISRLQTYLTEAGPARRGRRRRDRRGGRGAGRPAAGGDERRPGHRPGGAVHPRLHRADRRAAQPGSRAWPTSSRRRSHDRLDQYDSLPTQAEQLGSLTMAGALNRALADELRADERVLVYGEDVGRARRRLPGHRRPGRRVRRAAGVRLAAGRGRHRRHRDRHGDARPAPGGRDAVRRLLLPGLRADHLAPGQAAQPHPRPDHGCRW